MFGPQGLNRVWLETCWKVRDETRLQYVGICVFDQLRLHSGERRRRGMKRRGEEMRGEEKKGNKGEEERPATVSQLC